MTLRRSVRYADDIFISSSFSKVARESAAREQKTRRRGKQPLVVGVILFRFHSWYSSSSTQSRFCVRFCPLFPSSLFLVVVSSNRVSVSYSDQKKTISLIADVYLAKLSLLKRSSSSMRNENDDSSDFLERLSMSRQNERRKEAMREAHERTNFIYPVFSNNNKTTLYFFFLNGPFFRFRVPLFSARHISRRIHTHTNALSSSFG